MRTVSALLLLLAASAAVAADPLPSDQLPATGPLPEQPGTLEYPTVDAAFAALHQMPGAKFSEQDGWTIVSVDDSGGGHALWSFVPGKHPAYPAVVKRSFEQRGDAVYLRMGVLCRASKQACDALVRDFQALNDQMMREIQGRREAASPAQH